MMPRRPEALILTVDGFVMATIVDLGKIMKDEPQHRRTIFGGLEVGVSSQVVGGCPEIIFKLLELLFIQ